MLEGAATTLSSLPSLTGEQGTFDAVLLLGPLYHIMDPALRDTAIREAWSMVRPGCGDAADGGGTLFCAWVSRWAHYRDIALRDPGRLLARKEVYTQHARDGNYVRLDEQGVAYHAMHHELPANMPRMLARVTERPKEEVHMVGTEGVLTVGLDKLVNEMQGEEFEVGITLHLTSVRVLMVFAGLGAEVLRDGHERVRVDDGRPHCRIRVEVVIFWHPITVLHDVSRVRPHIVRYQVVVFR